MYPPREPEVLEHRNFAMPYGGTRIGGEDYRHLDPNDEEDRRLLLIGEHPECHVIWEDPMFDGEIGGTSPRMHITMDLIVVNQLWDNNPPEVWEAAQRLRAAGIERLDVIHKIASVLVNHMFPVLKYQKQFDEAAYRTELNTLK